MDEEEDILDEFTPTTVEEEFPVPEIPTIDYLPPVVDYSHRNPGDFVLGGPVGAGRGHGRHFATLKDAVKWAQEKYGKNRVGVLPQQGPFRWGLLIRKG